MPMHTDYEYWRNVTPPASPSVEDTQLISENIKGNKVLLFGSTKIFLDLVTHAYDLYPKYSDPKIKHKDWLTLNEQFDTIIGCGPFNFTKVMTDKLFPLCQKHCSRLIIRVIHTIPWTPKYAQFFPMPDYFNPQPIILHKNDSHYIGMWDFYA